MKIVLAGSPQISVNTFEKVINNFEVVAIVTQPDKPKGRGMKMEQTPVANLGDKYGIKVFKPNKISEIYDELKSLNFDLFLTFAFGQWIPTSILELGKYKPMNIHGSLLPKYRGAAPIHYAILNGDKEIGITLMEMVKEMDAGAMYFKASKEITEDTTTGEAFNIIDNLASENIIDWINKINSGDVNPIEQGNDFTLSPKIEKSFGELNNELTIYEAQRRIKGLNPFPGAFIYIDGKRIKIFNYTNEYKDGMLKIKFSDGELNINSFQYEGKKRRDI